MSPTPSVADELQTDERSPARPLLGTHGPLFLWPIIAIACVFGPYLVSGVRTEQLAMIASAALAGVALLVRRRLISALRPGWLVLLLWSAYALVAAIGALVVRNRLPWGSGSLVAGLDNALLPLATMLAVATWLVLFDRQHLLRVASWSAVIGMTANGALALLTAYVGADRVPLLRLFWAAAGEDVTVAELAAGNGRYSGLFNQPAEAGVAYSLALFCLIYLMRTRDGLPTKVWLPGWVLLLVGGLLTLSKIFIIGGVFVGALMILTGRRQRVAMVIASVGVVLASGLFAGLGALGGWGASGQINWYVDSAKAGNSWAYTLSAGRFGEASEEGGGSLAGDPPPTEESSGTPQEGSDIPEKYREPGGLVQLSKTVLDEHPWIGVGARGLPVSYDATWVETVIVAGSAGLILMVGVHLALLVRWLRLRRNLLREEWRLAGAVVLLTWGSSFGLPSLTGNRESTLMWIMLSILLVFQSPQQRDAALAGAPR